MRRVSSGKCRDSRIEERRSTRRCVYSAELDLSTLVWTRGRDFPLSRLESRLKCPKCGSRDVTLLFSVPPVPARMKA